MVAIGHHILLELESIMARINAEPENLKRAGDKERDTGIPIPPYWTKGYMPFEF